MIEFAIKLKPFDEHRVPKCGISVKQARKPVYFEIKQSHLLRGKKNMVYLDAKKTVLPDVLIMF